MAQPRFDAEALLWPDFLEWWHRAWRPGDHLSVIAPQGAGKSTFVGGILESSRNYVLVLDPKGGDETITSLGWPRLTAWPSDREMDRLLEEDEKKNRPSRYLVGPVSTRGSDFVRLRQCCKQALDAAFDMGGWTVYVDELQVLCDRRLMNLGGEAARLLISARSRKVTFVSSFQAPSWVISEAMRQPTWVAVSYTRDIDTINRLAEIMGRDKAEMRGAIRELPPFCWLLVGRNPREPLRITKPPRLHAPVVATGGAGR